MWQLPFNISKCKILHIGQFNPKYCYKMDGMDIVKVNEEKDLGVLIDCNLKFHSQCLAVVNKANRLLGLTKQTVSGISPVCRFIYMFIQINSTSYFRIW